MASKQNSPLSTVDLSTGLQRHADMAIDAAALPMLMGNAFFAELVQRAGVGMLAAAAADQIQLGAWVSPLSRSRDEDADRRTASGGRAVGSSLRDIGWDERREQDEFAPRHDDKTLFFDEGAGARPEIDHDHGFLDDGSHNVDETLKEEPGAQDYALLAACVAAVESAELLRPDLVDATAAVRHYLDGGGATREPELERFFAQDTAGKIILNSIIEDAQIGAESVHAEKMYANPESPDTSPMDLQMHSWKPVVVGSDARFPYPATENWQKAIGGFSIWANANLSATVDENDWTRTVQLSVAIEMEDMYNFNPGQNDIATGVPDAVFGRLQVVGLGHEFLQVGTAQRELSFTRAIARPECDPDKPDTIGGGEDGPRRPEGARPYPHT